MHRKNNPRSLAPDGLTLLNIMNTPILLRDVCILTVSDRCSQGITEDTAGPAVGQVVREELHWQILETALVADEMNLIADQLRQWASRPKPPALILTVGGTGLSPRDVTPEATLQVITRQASPLMELARLRCFAKTPKAYLSRGIAGIATSTLIINLPGSRNGATETLRALLDLLPHAISTMLGENSHR